MLFKENLMKNRFHPRNIPKFKDGGLMALSQILGKHNYIFYIFYKHSQNLAVSCIVF